MDMTVPVTQTAVFVCVGQGYGYVDVIWLRGSRDRSPPERSTVTTMVTEDDVTTITSILTIFDVNDNTPSRYRCRYSNSEGEIDSSIASLTVGGKH